MLDHGNCESKYGEFDFRSKHYKKQIGCRKEGKGSIIGGIR
jgi:hypothetical protein